MQRVLLCPDIKRLSAVLRYLSQLLWFRKIAYFHDVRRIDADNSGSTRCLSSVIDQLVLAAAGLSALLQSSSAVSRTTAAITTAYYSLNFLNGLFIFYVYLQFSGVLLGFICLFQIGLQA